MITVFSGSDRTRHAELCRQMYRLRAQLFLNRRKWSVKVRDGEEIDCFDLQDPVYVCVTDPDQRLIGSLRLLPTMGPHMLSDVFPEVMGDARPIRRADTWESSRFCVDTQAARAFHPDGINEVTRALLGGLFGSARALGLQSIVSVYDIFVERILQRAGCRFTRLGPVHAYDGLNTVAGHFPVEMNLPSRFVAPGAVKSTLTESDAADGAPIAGTLSAILPARSLSVAAATAAFPQGRA
ncbi:acyl-homoserine-lactone synthase (plasmid) [Azospirillum sp. B510]|nr:acyl-homoserine-lactone synthase [Azospirillum sp. B510]